MIIKVIGILLIIPIICITIMAFRKDESLKEAIITTLIVVGFTIGMWMLFFG